MFSSKVEAAFALAAHRHRDQTRKGSDLPYITHPAHVAVILSRLGYGDDELVTALLHDVLEDTARDAAELASLRRQILEAFGATILVALDELSEPKRDEREIEIPWRERKKSYIDHLERAGFLSLRVSAADKLHNLSTLLDDLERIGESVWNRFRAGSEDSLWFYKSVASVLQRRLSGEDKARPLIEDLATAIAALEERIGSGAARE